MDKKTSARVQFASGRDSPFQPETAALAKGIRPKGQTQKRLAPKAYQKPNSTQGTTHPLGQALGQAEPNPRNTPNTRYRPPFPSPYEGEGGRRPDEGGSQIFHNELTASQPHRFHPHPALSLKGEGISGIPFVPIVVSAALDQRSGDILVPAKPQRGGTPKTSNMNLTQALGQAEFRTRKTPNTRYRPPISFSL